MSKDRQISLRMDPRLYNLAQEARQRFNDQMFAERGFPPMSFNSFIEVAVNEWLSQQCPDLHRVAFNRGGDAA